MVAGWMNDNAQWRCNGLSVEFTYQHFIIAITVSTSTALLQTNVKCSDFGLKKLIFAHPKLVPSSQSTKLGLLICNSYGPYGRRWPARLGRNMKYRPRLSKALVLKWQVQVRLGRETDPIAVHRHDFQLVLPSLALIGLPYFPRQFFFVSDDPLFQAG